MLAYLLQCHIVLFFTKYSAVYYAVTDTDKGKLCCITQTTIGMLGY